MIFPKKKTAVPSTARSPDLLYLDSSKGWEISGSSESAALRVSAFYRALSFRAETMSVMPFYIMDRETKERIREHRLTELLTLRANEAMSPSEYRSLMQLMADLRGNAYAYISRNPRTGYIDEVIPLTPELVKPTLDSERNLHYLYADPKSGKGYDLMPSQVIHYKGFTTNGIEGKSLAHYAREALAKDREAKAYERAIYRNGGRPSGVLETQADLGGKTTVKDADGKEIEISKKEMIRRSWEKVHNGGDNAFRVAVLDHGLTYHPIAMNNSDAQFVESNDITIADIARFTGVPLHVLMAGKQSYESNLQNRVEFIQTTALALVTRCEDEDSYKLLSGDDRGLLRIRRNMDAALRGDTESRASFYRTMREIGAYSVDDIMALEDRPKVPGGHTRQASLNYVPLELFYELSRNRNGGSNADTGE
ncbi:MAG: phage portal protein [Oscillospiraceae bacterium]|nr:phage portal protein [Oscillospiraceae bacterium]